MSNNFYNPSGTPSNNSPGSSSAMRAEFTAIGAGFDKLPNLTGGAGKALVVNTGENAIDLVSVLDTSTNQTVGGVKTFSSSPIVPTPTLGDSSTKAASTAFVANATAGLDAFKNKIINGCFRIAQRAPSQSSNGYGSVDRWTPWSVGSLHGCSQNTFVLGQTAVPNNPKNYFKQIVTSSAGASNYSSVAQYIEGCDTFSGQTCTLSFYAWVTSGTKNLSTEFVQRFGTGGAPSASVEGLGVTKHALTTTPTLFTVTVTLPSVSGKTVGSNDDSALGLIFWFDAGSTFNSRTASLGQQSGEFNISQIQVESGSIASHFEIRPQIIEDDLCRRFFERQRLCMRFYATAANQFIFQALNYLPKRAVPTITSPGSNVINATMTYPSSQNNYSCRAQMTAVASGAASYSDEIVNIDAEIN